MISRQQIENILASEKCEIFSVSFLFHAVVLCLLSFIFCSLPEENTVSIIISSIEEDVSVVEQTEIVLEDITMFDTKETSFVENSNPIAESKSSSLMVEIKDIPSVVELNTDIGVGIPQQEIISDKISGISTLVGGGLSTESSTGGALDRLTIEIIDAAYLKNVNVVWLFDASVSLNHQRQDIYNRFDRILEEIDIANPKYEVNHAICSFGSGINFLSESPTNDPKILQHSISSISIDETGIENVFNAIGESCKKYSKPKTRCMIILFTDEIGDDQSISDTVSTFVRGKGCSVYIVGSPSPFGKSTTQFKFVEFDPKYDNVEKWVEIQQGPETMVDMILDLKSLPIDDETFDSGFGPFALSKFCIDTGGIFFSVHPNRNSGQNTKRDISPLSSYISRFFDHDVMRDYKPDYRSIAVQNRDISNNICKQSLIRAATIPINISGEQILRFKAYNEGMFAEELGMAQRFSAKLEPKINEVYNILLSGEQAYKTIEDKRWAASYALAMGRILATKCRIETYNYMLAEAKTGIKKKNPKSNIWILSHTKDFTTTNSSLRKNYDASQKYLKYVSETFPNTPWSAIANAELETPIGYFWTEEYQEPPKPNGGGGGNNNPKDDMLKPKMIPKPTRKINKI